MLNGAAESGVGNSPENPLLGGAEGVAFGGGPADWDNPPCTPEGVKKSQRPPHPPFGHPLPVGARELSLTIFSHLPSRGGD